MDENNIPDISALLTPFPKSLHQTKKGRGNRAMTYVGWPEYCRRLNDAFGGAWAFEVADEMVLDRQCVVKASLTILGVTRMAFGGSEMASANDPPRSYDVADALKSAQSDALRKAASLFGLGLDLWAGTDGTNPAARGAEQPPPANGASKTRTAELATRSQVDAILDLGKQLGMSPAKTLASVRKTMQGTPETMPTLDQLTRFDAAEVIRRMREATSRNGTKPAPPGGGGKP